MAETPEPNPPHPTHPATLDYALADPDERRKKSWRAFKISLILLGSACFFLFCVSVVLVPTLGKSRPTANIIKCTSNLRQIGQACLLFANENQGRFPISFAQALSTQDISAQVFTCPALNTRAPTTYPSAWPDLHGDYIYTGAGLDLTAPPGIIIARDKLPSPHGPLGTNVLFSDGQAVTIPTVDLPKLLAESDRLRQQWESQRHPTTAPHNR